MILKLSDGKFHDVVLEDDGTLDTLVQVDGTMTMRFNQEYVAEFRNKKGGMTTSGLIALGSEVLEDQDGME